MEWKRGLGKTDAETVVVNAKPVYDHVTKRASRYSQPNDMFQTASIDGAGAEQQALLR
jgi:hypothetical protein